MCLIRLMTNVPPSLNLPNVRLVVTKVVMKWETTCRAIITSTNYSLRRLRRLVNGIIVIIASKYICTYYYICSKWSGWRPDQVEQNWILSRYIKENTYKLCTHHINHKTISIPQVITLLRIVNHCSPTRYHNINLFYSCTVHSTTHRKNRVFKYTHHINISHQHSIQVVTC